jgi:hypothetical protein
VRIILQSGVGEQPEFLEHVEDACRGRPSPGQECRDLGAGDEDDEQGLFIHRERRRAVISVQPQAPFLAGAQIEGAQTPAAVRIAVGTKLGVETDEAAIRKACECGPALPH